MHDIIFYEVFAEEKQQIIKYLPKNIKVIFTDKTIQETGYVRAKAKLISIRTLSVVPLAWSKEIKGILTRSQGYDHLIKYQRDANTKLSCGYLGEYCSRAVAEQAIMAMLVLMRKLTKQIRQFDSFTRDGLTGAECLGKQALIVGVGNIGTEIAKLVHALGMQVTGVDIVKRNKLLKYVSLAQGLKRADVVFCALPLTPSTKGLLNFNMLRKVKKGAFFINISRGEISPLSDLNKLLQQGFLGGLSLDVYDDEKTLARMLRHQKPSNSQNQKIITQLKTYDNVLFTPHNAFNTKEALEHKARLSVAAAMQFLKTGRFPNPIKLK